MRLDALAPCRFPVELLSRGLLLLYAPFGLCLLLLRVFIGAHVFLVSCVLPDCAVRRSVLLVIGSGAPYPPPPSHTLLLFSGVRFLVRVMTSVLGVLVTQSGEQDPAVKIYVSNHTSSIDHNVLGLLTACSAVSDMA